MRSFQLRMLNYPAERLFKPRQRLRPIKVPDQIKSSLPFSESSHNCITATDDFIVFIDHFTVGFDIDYVTDFKEYAESNEFYLFFKDIFSNNESQLLIVIKYLYASKRVLQGLVVDDSVFSFHLPYLAEASFDLECSLKLIETGYFKQSLQALRNVIEVTLLHSFYALKDLSYDDLMNEEPISTPTFKNIMIFLRSENLFNGDLERQIFEVYKILSGAVHSELRKLNTGRTITDEYSFNEWYVLCTKVSALHLNLIVRMCEIGI